MTHGRRRRRTRGTRRGWAAHGALVLGLGLALGCQSSNRAPAPASVASVDLERYLGTWYEIASLPNRFQRGCVATRATYSRRDDGRIRVVNECRDGSVDGARRSVAGVAWPVEGSGGARLKVRFFWPFAGNYWVLALDPAYRYALVGEPSRRYLWILSRTPELSAAELERLLEAARAAGYDTERVRRTPQRAE